MSKLVTYAHNYLKLELMKHCIEVFQNKIGSRGVDLVVKTKTGNYDEVSLQVFNLEAAERTVKIPKSG